MAYDTLLWLEDWYLSHCDGDWEHQEGVEIGTLDNPGWSLEISLTNTELEGLAFEPVRIERTDNDWLSCEVKSGKFTGTCGPKNLVETIEVFRAWTASHALTLFDERKSARLRK